MFDRLDERMSAEVDVSEKAKLRKVSRRLGTVHQELKEYNEFILECASTSHVVLFLTNPSALILTSKADLTVM